MYKVRLYTLGTVIVTCFINTFFIRYYQVQYSIPVVVRTVSRVKHLTCWSNVYPILFPPHLWLKFETAEVCDVINIYICLQSTMFSPSKLDEMKLLQTVFYKIVFCD